MGKKSLRTSVILLLILSLSSISANMIRISKAQGIHDIAVTNVTPSETLVESGSLVNITVVVENQGTESETHNVTLYRDAVPIEINRTVTDLAAGQNRTLVFTWNTTDTLEEIYLSLHKEKTYDIKAVATLLSDSDPGDNTLTSSSKIKVISQYIAISPERTVDETLTTGKNYTISIITDYNGTDVWGWNVELTFSPAVLECVKVVDGDLITVDKDPSAVFNSEINNTVGVVSAGAYFYYLPPDAPPTTNGPGTLANVTFKVVSTGNSNITLGKVGTYVQVSNPSPIHPDPYDIIDDYLPGLNHVISGYFSNAPTGIVDIAIISVKPSQTKVTQGDEVNINVTVKNQGTLDQTFDVKLYYGYNPGFPGQNVIETKTMQSLAAGATQTLISVWNTTEAKEGTYVVTAIISGVQGDVDMSNNRLDSNETVAVNLKELRPLPITELIIGAVAVIAVIAVISFVLRRRRKKPALE